MIFGGIQETTLLDFPGRLACVLFTAGCNFKCPYCHNPDLLSFSTAQVIKESWVMRFLEERAGFLDGVVITGGEPTLHKELAGFIRRVRDLGMEIKLDTNGSRPGVLCDILQQGLADYVAMDFKTLPAHYAERVLSPVSPEKIRESLRLIVGSGVDHEFRTTCVWPMVDIRIVKKMAELVRGARLWVFQECRPQRMLVPDFLETAGKAYSREEVESLASLAMAYVEKVAVR